jgi:hypothetical protein
MGACNFLPTPNVAVEPEVAVVLAVLAELKSGFGIIKSTH